MRVGARKREESEENFPPRDGNISVARVRAREEKRKEEKRIREKKGRKGREGVAEEILRLRKSLEMGGEERRQGRERRNFFSSRLSSRRKFHRERERGRSNEKSKGGRRGRR